MTHRSVFFSALARGVSEIHNPLPADDCLSTARCMEALGARIEKKDRLWVVEGRGLRAPNGDLDCGNSGTTMRLISGILAGQDFVSRLVGDASLSGRPMQRVAEPLRRMGAEVSLTEGRHAPMSIRGTKSLRPIDYVSPVASAQVKSCVLLAGLHAEGETHFTEPTLSRDHTERMLESCGATISRVGTRVTIRGRGELRPQKWVVPGDISSAAFLIVAGLLVDNADVRLTGVNLNPTRTGLLDVLSRMGARVDVTDRRTLGGEPGGDILLRGRDELKATALQEGEAPRLIDEIPILAVAATQARGTTKLLGVEELRFKETDRLAAMAKNLSAMGASVREEKDGLVIEGPTPLHGADLSSFDDHRIAMSFAVASLIAAGETRIRGAEAVTISFPDFWSCLAELSGAR